MINIEPIEIPTKGTAITLEVRVLTFNLNSDSAIAYYALRDSNSNILLDGNLQIISEVFLNWGTDDSIIEDFVLETLNLERAAIIE